MKAERPTTSNFKWPQLFPQGLQVAEICQLNDTLAAIDRDVFNLGETLSSFTVSFKDIQDLPNTLEGYGITDAYTETETDEAIKAACDALKGEAPHELSTLEALAKALADDPKFSETIAAALAKRVAVDSEQTFKLAEKQQARDNIEALGIVDKGAANGVAPLDASSKVPPAYLPPQTTTATVGAAMAGANAISLPDDGDTFAGVKAGTSTMFRITWGNIKAAISTLINTVVSGNMPGRAYPRRSDGAAISFQWSGQGGQPTWLWGGNGDGTAYQVWNPANFSVNYANSANWANGAAYADRIGNGGWTLGDIQWSINNVRPTIGGFNLSGNGETWTNNTGKNVLVTVYAYASTGIQLTVIVNGGTFMGLSGSAEKKETAFVVLGPGGYISISRSGNGGYGVRCGYVG